jgi:hypothetical protein
MKKDSIYLSYLEITPKLFDVIFYCREIESIAQEQQKNYYIKNLKTNGDVNGKFAVQFVAGDGFQKSKLESLSDLDLTKKYLLYHFREKLRQVGITPIQINKDKYQRSYFALESHPEGVESVWVEPYFFKPNKSFGFLVDFKFWVNDEYRKSLSGPLDKRILLLSGTLDSRGNSNKAFYQFKFSKIKAFLNKYHSSIKTFTVVGLDLTIASTLTQIGADSLNPKTYQFQNDVENSSPYFGLQKNHPFQSPEGNFHFLFLFRDSDRGIAINLLNGLKGKSSPNTFPGMESLFRINFNNDCIQGRKVEEFSLPVLESVVEEILRERVNGRNILPIFITNSRVTPFDDRLYFLIKHTFTKSNIACQVVTKDLINNTKALSWSLSNIGLQIFAKMGGKPWKVKPAIKDSLIIGIGSKNKEVLVKNEDGSTSKTIEKYLTYSVLTDSSGLFKEIQILSEADNEIEYYDSLVKKFTTIINQSIKEGYKDFTVHTPFRISKTKVWDLVFKAIATRVTISIVVINDQHKFFGYDLSKNGLVPYESTYVSLSDREFLVWFEGLQYNNAPFSKPIGSPIYIDFWYSNNTQFSQNVAMQRSLLQDCINLSGANWRGFKAKQLPVSIYYCQKIADFLKKFEDYELEHIEFENLKPWFL